MGCSAYRGREKPDRGDGSTIRWTGRSEEEIAGVKIIERLQSEREEIVKEFEAQGWTYGGGEPSIYHLQDLMKGWRRAYPEYEAMAVKDKRHCYRLFYRPKHQPGVREAGREKPETKNWKDLVTSLRVRNYNWKYIIEEVSKKYYYVPEKEIVDFIIAKYVGRENLKRAVLKPERRIVFLAPIEGFPTSVPGISYYYLVEGVGMRYFTDLSFDPFEISMLEKTGIYPPEAAIGELRKILGEYRQGLVDAASAMEKIREVVERIR